MSYIKTIDVLNLFRAIYPGFDYYYIEQMDSTENEKILLIRNGTSMPQTRSYGGYEYANVGRLGCNGIIHWNKNASETEQVANEIKDIIINIFSETTKPIINDLVIVDIIIRRCLSIGKDINDICEYAFDFEVVYDNREQYLKKGSAK